MNVTFENKYIRVAYECKHVKSEKILRTLELKLLIHELAIYFIFFFYLHIQFKNEIGIDENLKQIEFGAKNKAY